MPRLPALVRRLRRPGVLFWDIALAVALAVVSLLTYQPGRGVKTPAGPEVHLSPVPPRVAAGKPWNVQVILRNPSRPLARGEPRLTLQNAKTGETTIYASRATSKPGVYRIRAVFPVRGTYSYWVTGGGIEPIVTIGKRSAPPARALPSGKRGTNSSDDSSPVWPVALALLATLPVALRRRYPIPVLTVTLSAALAFDVFYSNFFFPGALVALYTVAARVGRPRSTQIGVATAVALTITFFDASGIDSNLGHWQDLIGRGAVFAVFGGAWLLGDNVRTRRAYLREIEERAARLEREREANARRAAAEEQARIARELHDIIAHNVSVMTVQAAAAGDAFEMRPDRVREALGSIESTGREALTELRRLLGSVRPNDGLGTFGPQPGLTRLDALIEHVRSAGLPVELSVEGSPFELPPGVDLSAYRIVQEALTNTLKHAHASKATVLVRYGAGALELEVVDDGRGETADGTYRGHGIIGMRERATLLGAELRVGPAPGGGFAVRTRIPLEESES